MKQRTVCKRMKISKVREKRKALNKNKGTLKISRYIRKAKTRKQNVGK